MGNEPLEAVHVMLPKAGWPGAEVGAWAGAGAASVLLWAELSKVMALCCCPLRDAMMGWAVALGFTGSFKVGVGLQKLGAGGLVATVTEAILPLGRV